MSSDDLSHMPATIIDEIEVILSPGAKESAESYEGGGYIVNIISKKNKLNNNNGSVNASASTNNSNSGTVNLGRKSGKFNFFAMASVSTDKWHSRNRSERINYLSSGTHFLNSYGKDDGSGNLLFSKRGLDYYYDGNNTFTLYTNYNKERIEAKRAELQSVIG